MVDAARDALYAMRDAIRDMTMLQATLESAVVANRLREQGIDPAYLKGRLRGFQERLAHEASVYSHLMFGENVDLLPE